MRTARKMPGSNNWSAVLHVLVLVTVSEKLLSQEFPWQKGIPEWNLYISVTYVYTTPENYLHVFHIPFLSVHPAVGLDHSEDKVPMPRSRKLGGSGKAYVWVQSLAFSAKSSGWRNWRVAASRFMGSLGSGAPSKATTDSTTLEIRQRALQCSDNNILMHTSPLSAETFGWRILVKILNLGGRYG